MALWSRGRQHSSIRPWFVGFQKGKCESLAKLWGNLGRWIDISRGHIDGFHLRCCATNRIIHHFALVWIFLISQVQGLYRLHYEYSPLTVEQNSHQTSILSSTYWLNCWWAAFQTKTLHQPPPIAFYHAWCLSLLIPPPSLLSHPFIWITIFSLKQNYLQITGPTQHDHFTIIWCRKCPNINEKNANNTNNAKAKYAKITLDTKFPCWYRKNAAKSNKFCWDTTTVTPRKQPTVNAVENRLRMKVPNTAKSRWSNADQ